MPDQSGHHYWSYAFQMAPAIQDEQYRAQALARLALLKTSYKAARKRVEEQKVRDDRSH